MQRIATLDDIAAALDALCRQDPRLGAVRQVSGEIPLRLSEPGFASLVSIIVSQQVSRASADAIFGRLSALASPLTPQALLDGGDALYRAAGLSRPKQRTLLALSQAVAGGLDLDRLCGIDAEAAMAEMLAVPGIGPWTAEVYLLFSARDVALQSAVGHALGIEPRPGEKELARIAESWAPYRGVASRLFWAYYRVIKGREGAPPSSTLTKP